MQIAVVNKSKKVTDDQLAYVCKGVDAQVIEAAEKLGCQPTPVVFYVSEEDLPQSNCRLLIIVDSMPEAPGAAGYHTDEAGVIYSRCLVFGTIDDLSVTISHEALEEMFDPTCDQYAQMTNETSVAKEVCDPVEADTYAMGVVIGQGTEPVQVWLSNYVLPSWFDADGAFPYDRMQKLSAPFTMTDGGYMVVRDKRGDDHDIFAFTVASNDRAQASIDRKIALADTRLSRRVTVRGQVL